MTINEITSPIIMTVASPAKSIGKEWICPAMRAYHVHFRHVDADGEITGRELNCPLFTFALSCKHYPLPETGRVVRNRSAKGHQIPRNRQQIMLSGFCLC